MTKSNAQAELDDLNRIAELIQQGAPFGEIGRDWPGEPKSEPRDGPRPASLVLVARIAALLSRGIPLGEIGRDWPGKSEPEPRDVNHQEPLLLASGLLDDGRRTLASDDDKYSLFLYALRWQDTWSDEEHKSFWHGALDLWPRNRGKRSHTYALAYALVIALEGRVELEGFLRLLSIELRGKAITGLTAEEFTLPDLQRRDVVRIARQMIAGPRHLYPDSGRLPRVVTDEEIVPHLAVVHDPLRAYSAAGDASWEIIQAAQRVVEQVHNLWNVR